jgi:hypothetical protein
MSDSSDQFDVNTQTPCSVVEAVVTAAVISATIAVMFALPWGLYTLVSRSYGSAILIFWILQVGLGFAVARQLGPYSWSYTALFGGATVAAVVGCLAVIGILVLVGTELNPKGWLVLTLPATLAAAAIAFVGSAVYRRQPSGESS